MWLLLERKAAMPRVEGDNELTTKLTLSGKLVQAIDKRGSGRNDLGACRNWMRRSVRDREAAVFSDRSHDPGNVEAAPSVEFCLGSMFNEMILDPKSQQSPAARQAGVGHELKHG